MSDEMLPQPSPGSSLVGSPLAPQLGTDPIDLAKMKFDMRRLTVIKQSDIPLILYATIRGRKSRAWQSLIMVLENYNVSIDGRGRRDIIRMEAVSRGGPASVEAEINRPGWFGRNITQRDWEEEQRKSAL